MDLILTVLESPSSDLSLIKTSAQVVSRLLSLQPRGAGELSSAEPSNYDKLPREGLLRTIFDILSGTSGKKVSENAMLCCLGSLCEGASPFSAEVISDVAVTPEMVSPKMRLPPVDWTTAFSHLTQPGVFGERMRMAVTRFLLQKASYSVSFSFLSQP